MRSTKTPTTTSKKYVQKYVPYVRKSDPTEFGTLKVKHQKAGPITASNYISVDGMDAIIWVQQHAKKLDLTEAKVCRMLLNAAIQAEMLRDHA